MWAIKTSKETNKPKKKKKPNNLPSEIKVIPDFLPLVLYNLRSSREVAFPAQL